MTAAWHVNSAASYCPVTTGHTLALPPNREIGDLIVVYFLMNGLPSLPGANWTQKYYTENAYMLLYARVDGTIIPAGSGGTAVFGNGGGAAYYDYTVALIRGAKETGDPFDAVIHGTRNATSPATYPLALTTTMADVLLILTSANIYQYPTVTAVEAPLILHTPALNYGHLSSGVQAVAGPSGNKFYTYAANTPYSWSMLYGIKPAVGGRDKFKKPDGTVVDPSSYRFKKPDNSVVTPTKLLVKKPDNSIVQIWP